MCYRRYHPPLLPRTKAHPILPAGLFLHPLFSMIFNHTGETATVITLSDRGREAQRKGLGIVGIMMESTEDS